MVDRSNEIERLKRFLKAKKGDTAKIMAIPDQAELEQLTDILESQGIDLTDSSLFIFCHHEIPQLLNDDEIPMKIKKTLDQSYEEAKSEFKRVHTMKEVLGKAEELKEFFESTDPHDPSIDASLVKQLFELAAHAGPDLFDYDEETGDNAQVLKSTIKALDICPFLEAFPIALTSALRDLSKVEESKESEWFIEHSDTKGYFKKMEDCSTTVLPYLVSAFDQDPLLTQHIKTYQDMMVLFAILLAKTLQTESFISILFKNRLNQERKESKQKKKGEVIPFKTDTDQIN